MGYLEDHATQTKTIEVLGQRVVLSIVKQDYGQGWYCGYTRFEKSLCSRKDYYGIFEYVSVHGGVTFCEEDKDGSIVYGFDCNHLYDQLNPQLRDEAWLLKECEKMTKGVILAAKYSNKYDKAGKKGRENILAKLAEDYKKLNLGSVYVYL